MSKMTHYDIRHGAGSTKLSCSVDLLIAADAVASDCTEGLLYLDASADHDDVLAIPVADSKSIR